MQSNPFATRFVRPGAIPYLFPAGESAAAVVRRLAEMDWMAQIVGPHGSGKSTLLATLTPHIEAAGKTPLAVTLHEGDRSLPREAWRRLREGPPNLLIIDGFEQLGSFSRWRAKSVCRRKSVGLLVTSHRSVGLPTLWTTATSRETTRAIVNSLLAASDRPIADSDVDRCFDRCQGNVRETLFALYDLAERKPT